MNSSDARRFLLLVAVVLANFFAGSVTGAGNVTPINDNIARGIFSLGPAWVPFDSEILANSNISGIVVQRDWEDLEPELRNPRKYETSFILSEFDRAHAWGKEVKLTVNSGGVGAPEWLLSRVGTFSYRDSNSFHDTYGRLIEIPLFWNKRFLRYKINLIWALGRKLGAHPALTLVAANCANGYNDDWDIPSKRRADIANWRAAGYSDNKLFNACKQVLDATMRAFPNQIVAMAIGRTPGELSSDVDYVARELINYANFQYPGRFIAVRHNLSAASIDPRRTSKLHNWQLLLDNEPNTAGQMLWTVRDTKTCRMNGGKKPCYPAGMLEKAADIGHAYGMRFVEIYGRDVTQRGLAASIRRIAFQYR